MWIVAVSTDKVLACTHFTWLGSAATSHILLTDLWPKVSTIHFSLLHSWWPRHSCWISSMSAMCLRKTNLYVCIVELRSPIAKPSLIFQHLLLLGGTHWSYRPNGISHHSSSWIARLNSRVRTLGCLRQIGILNGSYPSREWCTSLFVVQILASEIVLWVLLVFHAKLLKYLVTFLWCRRVRIAHLLRTVHILFL